MKNVAVILSGCGNRDGSELQETISLFYALDKRGIQYTCFAPDGPLKVVSYTSVSGETGETRNIYAEAARVARGDIRPLAEFSVSDYDALALPGGLGAVRNLSTYAFNGSKMEVNPLVEQVIMSMHSAGKPICAMCIAPMLLAKVLGRFGVKLTFGDICAASKTAVALGAVHEVVEATGCCVDERNKVVTTPAYMVSTHISQIFDGANAMVAQLEKWL